LDASDILTVNLPLGINHLPATVQNVIAS